MSASFLGCCVLGSNKFQDLHASRVKAVGLACASNALGQEGRIKRFHRHPELEKEGAVQGIPQFGKVNLNLCEMAGDYRADAKNAYREAFKFLCIWPFAVSLSTLSSSLKSQWRDGEDQRVREL